MREKLFRSIAFAVVAALTVGVAPSLASVDALNDKLLADGMLMQKQTTMRRVYKKPMAVKKTARKVAEKPACQQVVRVEKERIIEKPVIIEKEVQAPAPVVEDTTITQPAVVETSTPVIIDRYEKRHRSLIHLGLFPFNLLGE